MSQTISNQLQKVLEAARLSPSSHNTQPWAVKINKTSQELTIGYDPNRRLPVGDPENRELYISLGCFIQTTLYACKDRGLEAVYRYTGKGPEDIARITFEKNSRNGNEWLSAIENRRSDRRLYEHKPLNEESLKLLRGLKYEKANLIIIDDPEKIAFLAKMTRESTYRIMSDQAFRNELSSWVRHNWTKQPDGMPGYAQGIPGPLSLIGSWFVKNMKVVPSDQAKKDAKRVKNSAAIGLICTNVQTLESWIDTGRLYVDACLAAEKFGIKTAGVSAPIIDEITNKKIVDELKLSKRPLTLIRFGYKKGRVRTTPRLSIEQFST